MDFKLMVALIHLFQVYIEIFNLIEEVNLWMIGLEPIILGLATAFGIYTAA